MSDNEGKELSIAKTEDLGVDRFDNMNNVEGLVAPGPGDHQTFSSSSDDELDDSERTEDPDEQQEQDGELVNNTVSVEVEVDRYGHIYVRSLQLESFLSELELTRYSLPININISNNSGQEFTTYLANNSQINSSGPGRIGKPGKVMRNFGLKGGYGYHLEYSGYSLRYFSEDGKLKKEKVYNFHLDGNDIHSHSVDEEIGSGDNNNYSDPEYSPSDVAVTSEGVNERTRRQHVPPALQQPTRGPTSREFRVCNVNNGLRLGAVPYRNLMDQVGHPYKQSLELTVELVGEPYGRFLTSFSGYKDVMGGAIRQGTRFCKLAGYREGDMVRMHYLGHRAFQNGDKVHCLRTEKISLLEDRPNVLARGRKQRAVPEESTARATGTFHFQWVKYMDNRVYLKKEIMVTLLQDILELEHPIDYNLKLRVSKDVGDQEKQQDFYIRPGSEYHGGGYLQHPVTFRTFCGNPADGTISEFKYLGYINADAIIDRRYCLKLLTSNEEYLETPRSGEASGSGLGQKRGPKVAKKTAEPHPAGGEIEDNLDTPNPFLQPPVPDWVQRGQQVLPLQFHPPRSQQQQQQQQQQQLPQPRPQQQSQQPAGGLTAGHLPEVQEQQNAGFFITTTPSPYSIVPPLNFRTIQQTAVGDQQRVEQGQAQQAQAQPPQQQQQETSITEPVDAPKDWVSLVARCLRGRSDLDQDLVGDYYFISPSISAEDREIYGKMILTLAEDYSESSVKSLQRLLTRLVEKYQ